MANFEAVAELAQNYIRGEAELVPITDTEGCCTFRYQSCCYVS
jgi:hypothetical protein